MGRVRGPEALRPVDKTGSKTGVQKQGPCGLQGVAFSRATPQPTGYSPSSPPRNASTVRKGMHSGWKAHRGPAVVRRALCLCIRSSVMQAALRWGLCADFALYFGLYTKIIIVMP